MSESTSSPGSQRWSPWWAIVLTVLSSVVPGMILVAGLNQLGYAATGGHMSDLAEYVGWIAAITGLVLLAPGIAYLVLRRRLLFFGAMVLGGGLALLALLTVLGLF